MRQALLIVSIIAVTLHACSNKQKKERDGEVKYKTMTVSRSDQTLVSPYAAKLTGLQTVEIRPQVSGHITRICIDDGQQVKKGQALFIIDQVPYEAALHMAQANVETAKAKLATAQINYDNNLTLLAGKVVSEFTVQTSLNTLNEAKAALAQAKAQETNARNNLGYTVLKSPFDGFASMIPYHVGALVSSGITDPLVTITDDHEVNAYFSITENQTLDLIQQHGSLQRFIKQSPEVELKLSNGSIYPLCGHIDAINSIVDEKTGAVRLRAVFPNPQRLLREGGSATVLLSTKRKNCIVIPQEATYELQNRIFAYRIVDGKTKSTPIEVYRLNNGREYIVEQGLHEGDVIIAEGAGLLREGMEIK